MLDSVGSGPSGETSRPFFIRHFTPAVLWIVFSAGLAIQWISPRLKIEDNAFVVPSALLQKDTGVTLQSLITRERRLQTLSAILTLAGALGLAYHYRHIFVRPKSG